MIKVLKIIFIFIQIFVFTGLNLRASDYFPPKRVTVRPVFFVPSDEKDPTIEHMARLNKYIKKSREIFHGILNGKDTFAISKEKAIIINGEKPLSFYKKKSDWGVPEITGTILRKVGYNRFNAPYIFVIILMNSKDYFPMGGGRPFNGGFNTGGGLLITSSYSLIKNPYYLSTFIHELGHSFGLPHPDVYGYNLNENRSIMSYNMKHRTLFFKKSVTPGSLIPEDLRVLSMNKRVFPNLTFDPDSVGNNYKISPKIIWLGPMKIKGQSEYGIEVKTNSGEAFYSSVKNIVISMIKKNEGPGVTFDARYMWSSGKIKEWGIVDLRFPVDVTLDQIRVYSEHSGKYHRVTACVVEVKIGIGYEKVFDNKFLKADEVMDFVPSTSKVWRLHFKTASNYIVLRGLRFFLNNIEIFPQLVPYKD